VGNDPELPEYMQITVNGESRQVPDGATAAQLVELLELTGRRLAMEVNGEIVPKSLHESRALDPGDRVEIVHAVGGG
jgi:sulfur carrier protein